MKLVGGRATESYWLYGVAGALFLGGPVWHFLFVHDYPFNHPEAWVLPLAAALLGALLAITAHRIGGLVETLCFALLLYVFIDLQSDLHASVKSIVLMAICLAVAMILRERRALIACLMLGAFYVTALPRFGRAASPVSSRAVTSSPSGPPVLLHIVLDEQWGPGGLRAEGDTATASFLETFYTGRGFEIYDAAYSRYSLTIGALPLLMSLGEPPRIEMIQANSKYRVGSSPYFERLRAMGYQIRVYQSSLLNFCHAGVEVASCFEVPANSIANVASLEGPWSRRAVIAGRYFLNITSRTYQLLHTDAVAWRRSGTGGGLLAAERLRQDIAKGPPSGTAYFAHLLLPHAPFEVDAACRPYADVEHRIGHAPHRRLSDAEWERRLALYAAQTRCTHRKVAEILATLDSVAGRGASIVIVQGDHGARMGQDDFPDSVRLSRRDPRRLNGDFSTLFALRRPGVAATVHREPVPVQDFHAELVRGAFQTPVSRVWQHYVRVMAGPKAAGDTMRVLQPSEMLWAK